MPYTSAAQGPAESKKSHTKLQLNLPSPSVSQQIIPMLKVMQGSKGTVIKNEGPALDPADPSLLQDRYYFLNETRICLEYTYTLLQLLLAHWKPNRKGLSSFYPLSVWACWKSSSSLPLKIQRK